MEDLTTSYGVALGKDKYGGRGLFAERDFSFGEIVFKSSAAACTLHRKHYPLFCMNCHAFSENLSLPMPVSCSKCETTYYCSESCAREDLPIHHAHCNLLPVIEADQNLKKEETSLVRMLFRMLAKSALHSSSPVEIAPNSVPTATSKHVALMIKDHKNITGYSRRKKQRKTAAQAFVALLPNDGVKCKTCLSADLVEGTSMSSRLLSLDEQISVCKMNFRHPTIVEDLLAGGPLNEFALFDFDGEAVGCGFFPGAGLINHSCAPSLSVQMEGRNLCFYASCSITTGEELTQSYCNIDGEGRQNRQETLKSSWGFSCCCRRCMDVNMSDFDIVNLCPCRAIQVPFERRGSRVDSECQCNCFNLVHS